MANKSAIQYGIRLTQSRIADNEEMLLHDPNNDRIKDTIRTLEAHLSDLEDELAEIEEAENQN